MNKAYFKLFANCIPVLGAERSIVCDLQRFGFHFIPNVLFEILSEHSDKKIDDIKSYYDNEADAIIDEYFKFLEDHELGFFTNEPECFPKLENVWKTPSLINNAIIDIDSNSNHDYFKIASQLNKLNCKALEIRVYTEVSCADLNDIMDHFKDTRLQHILLIVKDSVGINREDLENIISENQKIIGIVVHSSDRTILADVENEKDGSLITYTKQKINSASHCGLIQTNYFSPNIETFFESLNYNSCLNKKIAIDKNGNIKNCPSMSDSFGNIKDTTLETAIEYPDFKKHWDTTKDHIEVCKDCEFRYICTDCRAYTEEPNNQYSKPLKCGYNPYTNVWEEWSENPLKQKAIEYYGIEGTVYNDAKI
jgi:SPASM domain peptide maturase of grasp-with-spasm system